MTKPRDELLERYAEAVAQDPRRPSDRVRNAARAHAQMLHDQAAAVQRAERGAPTKLAANQPQWTISLVASLAVVGLAGLLYVQIDRGVPEDREAALGTVVPTAAPSTPPVARPAPLSPPVQSDAPQAPPPEKPSPAKTTPYADKEMAPRPAAAPVVDVAQATANVTRERAYSTPLAEADMAATAVNKTANQLASAGSMRDAKSEAGAESAARMAPTARPATAMAPPAPAPMPAVPRRMNTTGVEAATTEFMEAARNGRTESLQKLLAQGVAINGRDDNSNTALMLAVRHGQAAAVRKLLALGADASLTNHEGMTALQIATQLGLLDMVQLLQAPQ